MKFLAVADEECAALWDHFIPGRLDNYDVILSCGDLKAQYLTFLVTMSHARLMYVRGNHDGSYASRPPEGCDDIDGCLVTYNGVRILGLGGCIRYNPGDNQYTDREMERRIAKLKRAIKKAGGVDIVVTHAPPEGYGDMEDDAHKGFASLVKLIKAYHPKFLLHGHVHLRYNGLMPREHNLEGTRIINVCDRFEFEIEDNVVSPKDKNRLIRNSKYTAPNEDFVYMKRWQ